LEHAPRQKCRLDLRSTIGRRQRDLFASPKLIPRPRYNIAGVYRGWAAGSEG
jgi:hypothetical protein